jgi:hypothetical protein
MDKNTSQTECDIDRVEYLLKHAEESIKPNYTYYQLHLMANNAPLSAYKKLAELMQKNFNLPEL